MIKIKRFEEILNTISGPEVKESAVLAEQFFKSQAGSSASFKTFVADFNSLAMQNPQLYSFYYTEGVVVISNALLTEDRKAKKPKISDINPIIATKDKSYYLYTGLLNKSFVIGYDTVKKDTSLYTKSLALVELLEKEHAFDEDATYIKGKEALFGKNGEGYGNKVLKAFSCYEDNLKKKDNNKTPAQIKELNNALAMGRIDIIGVVGDEVSLKLTVPNFRGDFGTHFMMYPYITFPYVAKVFVDMVNNLPERTFSERGKPVKDVRGVKIYQMTEDNSTKERFVAFNSAEYVKAVRRGAYRNVDESEEAQELFKNQIKKIKLGWNCLKLQLQGYNLEASLLGTAYTTIKLERMTNIINCSLKEIDTSKYMLDFDSLRKLFSVRIRAWKLNDFNEFNSICDTSECANRDERIRRIDNWAYNMEDTDLYNIMKKIKPELFIVKDENGTVVKDLDKGLDDTYNRKPYSAKHLRVIDLEDDFDQRLIQVKELLRTGLCKIECVSTRAGSPVKYYATNNDEVLKSGYRENQLMEYESSWKSLDDIYDKIEKDKITTFDNFIKKLMIAKVDGLVDYSKLDDNSTKDDWLLAVDKARYNGQGTDSTRKKASNPYLVRFKRLYAETSDKFNGSVDVRNIESIEFGTQKKR